MTEPTFTACPVCLSTGNSTFDCFFLHSTEEQKHGLMMFAARKGWYEQARTLSSHMSKASKARHAKRTPEERSAYAKMMVEAREAKRAHKNKP